MKSEFPGNRRGVPMAVRNTDALPVSPWIEVNDFQAPTGYASPYARENRPDWYCEQLEYGRILLFKKLPFTLVDDDQRFLLELEPAGSSVHKNVSYRSSKNQLRGFPDVAARIRVHRIMRDYSSAVVRFISDFLLPYAGRFKLDYASFRPVEAEGRVMPLHKRDDLLHFDAFPSRPTRGARILRVFTNLNPARARVWQIGSPFDVVAPALAVQCGLDRYARHRPFLRALRRLASAVTLLPNRSAYDRFMLRFHDCLKENTRFQAEVDKVRIEFPPGSTWLVFTDGVPHAVLSGQFALEQTFIVPAEALVAPESSPLRVLERLSGSQLS